MLRNHRLNNGKTPDFVSKQYVARYLRQSIDYLNRCKMFDGVTYKVALGNDRLYKWPEILRRIRAYKMEPTAMTHPNAEYTAGEIVADLDVHERTYHRHVEAGHLKVTKLERRTVILYKDYDWFRRNYCVRELVNRMKLEKLSITEVCILFGVKRDTFERTIKHGQITYTKKSLRAKRYFGKDEILKLLDNPIYGKHHAFRKNPMPASLPPKIACLYANLTPHYLSWLRGKGYVTPDPDHPTYTMTDSLEKVYQRNWFLRDYGVGSKYYTRQQIKNKFNTNDLWVDKYIVGKCDVYTRGNVRMTDAELHQKYKKVYYNTLFMNGWAQDDVDKIAASGVEAIPEPVKYVYREPKDVTNRAELRARKLELRKQNLKKYEKTIDPVELALESAILETELKREEHRRDVSRVYSEVVAYRNQIARNLELSEKPTATLTGRRLMEFSDTPENAYIIYSRSKLANLFMKSHPEPGACTFQTSDKSFMSIKKRAVFSVFTNIWRASKELAAIPPKVTPGWIILAPNSSKITDLSFLTKLANVPDDVGAVGAYGYEYFLPDGSWVKCPATYGMYCSYDNDMKSSSWVVGSRGYNSSHEVAIIDGPFIAVRGKYLGLLKNFDRFYILGEGGHSYVNTVISMMFKRLGVKLMQIPVECSKCSVYDVPVGSLAWNKAESILIDFGKTKTKLDI